GSTSLSCKFYRPGFLKKFSCDFIESFLSQSLPIIPYRNLLRQLERFLKTLLMVVVNVEKFILGVVHVGLPSLAAQLLGPRRINKRAINQRVFRQHVLIRQKSTSSQHRGGRRHSL